MVRRERLQPVRLCPTCRKETQIRAQIFIDRFGGWNNLEYILWINDMVGDYHKARNICKDYPIIDQDDFTKFILTEVS